jgi:hypothetical protein
MGLGTEQTTDRNIAALVGRMADGFSKLVSQHIQLARAELGEDIRGMGMDVARIAMVVPFLLVGYIFLCGAIAALLASVLGWAGALGLVAGVNLAVGGYLLYRSLTGLRARDVMNDSAQELTRSVSAALTTLQGASAASASNTVVAPQAQTISTQAPGAPVPANVLQQAAPTKNVLKEQPNGR